MSSGIFSSAGDCCTPIIMDRPVCVDTGNGIVEAFIVLFRDPKTLAITDSRIEDVSGNPVTGTIVQCRCDCGDEEAPEYTITPSLTTIGAGCGTITPDASQTVAAGSDVTFTFEPCPCPPPAEYPVVGWAFNDDDPYILQFSPDPATVPEGVQINLFDATGPVAFNAEGMAYVPSLAKLVMFMSNGDMYLVDPYNTTASTANPNVTFVGATGLNFPQGAEVYFDPTTGVETLYVVDDDERLVVVDVNTAAVLSAVPITGAYNNGDGLSINPLTGVAYVQNDDTVAFYQINLTTGVTVACFRTPPVDGEGIAFGADGYMYIEDEGQWGGARRIYRFLPPACGTNVAPSDFIPVAAYTNLAGDVEGIAFNGGAQAACEAIEILDVLIDGVSVGPVTSYTFTNVQDNHTVEVVFGIP